MIRSFIAAAALLLPAAARAHGLDGAGAGFAAGFAHPFSGLDHLAMMAGAGAVIGGLAVFVRAWAAVLAAAVGAAFAFAHGYVHAAALPEPAAPQAYAAGFVAGAAVLAAAGCVIVVLARRRYVPARM